MINSVPQRPMVLPVLAATVWVALGLVLFGSIGGLYGRLEEPIKENISQRLVANPETLQASLGCSETAAPTDQADPQVQAAFEGDRPSGS